MNKIFKRELLNNRTKQSLNKKISQMLKLINHFITQEKDAVRKEDLVHMKDIYENISYPPFIADTLTRYVSDNVSFVKNKKKGYNLKQASLQMHYGDGAELQNRNNTAQLGDEGKTADDNRFYIVAQVQSDKKVKPSTVIEFMKEMWRDVRGEELDTENMYGYVADGDVTNGNAEIVSKDVVAKDQGTKWDIPFYEQLYREIGIKRFTNLQDYYVFPFEVENNMTFLEDSHLDAMGAKGGQLFNVGGRINTSGNKGFMYRMKSDLNEYEDYSNLSIPLKNAYSKVFKGSVNEECENKKEEMVSEAKTNTVNERELICEGGAAGKMKHLYQDGKLTFGEMRQIFYDVFKGKTVLKEKLDGINLMVTYKNGNFGFARNKSQLKEPIDISKLGSRYDGNPKLREAFVNTANDITKAFESLDVDTLKRIFNEGQNFANVEIVYPPCRNILDYGNRCMLQINGIDCYDSKFNKISDNADDAKWLYENLKNHKALKQEMFEITEPNILRIKNSISADKALNVLLEEFDKLIDGYSLKTSIQDYANDRLRRYAINVCNHNNIEVEKDCQFIKELADRLSILSHKRPTKSDICTFAKRCGVNVHSDDYKNTINYLDENCDVMNEEIMRPIENIVMKAGTLLLKNLSGYMSCDPNKTSQKLVMELENTISEIEKDNSKLTSDKLKLFKKNMKRINEWQNRFVPSEGCIIKLRDGRIYKIVGSFGVANQIMHLLDK